MAASELTIPTAESFKVVKQADGHYLISYVDSTGTHRETFYEPATKLSTVIEASVEEDGPSNLVYRYKVRNSQMSSQAMSRVEIGFGGLITRVTSPIDWWTGTVAAVRVAAWTSGAESTGAQPGETVEIAFGSSRQPAPYRLSVASANSSDHLEGIALIYHPGTLPGVVNCYARAALGMFSDPIEPTDELVFFPVHWREDLLKGRTVGPVEIPSGGALAVVERLLEYVEILVYEGWSTQELGETLRTKLSEIRTAVIDRDDDKGIGALQRLSSFVREQHEAALLTSEGLAVMHYNLGYAEGAMQTARRNGED